VLVLVPASLPPVVWPVVFALLAMAVGTATAYLPKRI